MVLGLVVAVGVAVMYVRSRPVAYTSTAAVQLAPTSSSSSQSTVTIAPPVSASAPAIVASAASFLKTTSANAAFAASEVTISANATTGLVVVTATDARPGPAQLFAGAFAQAYVSVLQAQATKSLDQLVQERSSIARQITALSTAPHASTSPLIADELAAASQNYASVEGEIVALESAPAPASLYAPASTASVSATSKKKVYGLAGLAGLLAGFGLVLIWDRLDTRLRYASDVVSGVPVLAEIPFQARLNPRRNAGQPVIPVVDAPTSLLADRLRELRTAIQPISGSRSSSVVLLASHEDGDGKSFLVANLAASWALAGGRAVAVSTDLRAARLDVLLGASGAVRGLSSLLSTARGADPASPGEAVGEEAAGGPGSAATGGSRRDGTLPSAEDVLDAVTGTRVPGLSVLPAGPPVDADPGDLLAGPPMAKVVLELRKAYDLVVVDSPAIARVSDAVALVGLVDNVVVVARANRTDQRMLRETIARLTLAGARITGIVLNCSANYRTSQSVYPIGDGPGPIPPSDGNLRRIGSQDDGSWANKASGRRG